MTRYSWLQLAFVTLPVNFAGQGGDSTVELAAYLGVAYCAGHVYWQVLVGRLFKISRS